MMPSFRAQPEPGSRPRTPLRRLALPLAVYLLAALTACGGGPQLPVLPDDAIVLAFGDSLTAGKGAKPGEDYPSRLAAMTGLTVINAGIAGELSAQGRARLPDVLAEHQPDLVLLCHGGNDILRRNGADAIRANLHAMVETARAAGARVVLLAVPTLGLGLNPHPTYSELARELDLVIEPRVITDVLSDVSLKADGGHPNAVGYAFIAERLAALLRARGALQ